MNRLLVVLVCALMTVACASTAPSSPAPNATPVSAKTNASDTQFTVNALKADLQHLYQSMQSAHFDMYAHIPKAQYDRAFALALAEIKHPMNAMQAHLYFQKFLALGQVAHAYVIQQTDFFEAYRQQNGTAFPLGFSIRDDGVFISDNYSSDTGVQIGAQLISVDGVAVEQWINSLRVYISADNTALSNNLIQRQLPILVWYAYGTPSKFLLSIRNANGELRDLELESRTRTQMRSSQIDKPELLEINPYARHYRMLNAQVAYLYPGVFMNVIEGEDAFDPKSFHAFIDEAFNHFNSESAKSVVIDLRDNPGGDNSFSDHMISWFANKPFRFNSAFQIKVSPETIASNATRVKPGDDANISNQYAKRFSQVAAGEIIDFELPKAQPHAGRHFSGKIYVLINAGAYSNSVSVAAIVQDYGFGTIVGEATADLATTLGAMEQFSLPNTGMRIGFPKARIVRPNGDLQLKGVTPDVRIETPLIQGKNDPVLQRALQIIEHAKG